MYYLQSIHPSEKRVLANGHIVKLNPMVPSSQLMLFPVCVQKEISPSLWSEINTVNKFQGKEASEKLSFKYSYYLIPLRF